MAEQRREYFRVEYPIVERPVFSLTAGRFDVMDISEFGIKFYITVAHDFSPGQIIGGKVKFNDGRVLDIEGEILRCDDHSVSVRLTKSIPMMRIQKETVHLMMTYYAMFKKEEAAE
jgi:hypothetical protein